MRCVLILPVAISLLVAACTEHPCERKATVTLAEAQEDFRELRTLILGNHPINFAPRPRVVAVFDSQYSALREGMTILEFYRAAAQAVASVHCGHTRLSLPDCILKDICQNGGALPFDFKVIHDSIIIIGTYSAGQDVQRGTVVLSINETPADEIIKRIKSCLGADGANETYKYFLMNQEFGEFYLELLEDTTDFEIEMMNPTSQERGFRTVAAMNLRELRSRRPATPGTASENRLIQTDADSVLGYAILKIKFFGFYDNLGDFTAPIDSFFRTLAARHIGSLILDLRGNDGGDPYSSAYLLGYLIGEPFNYYSRQSTSLFDDLKELQTVPDNCFRGRLYVLVDGGCYSTTGHLLSILRAHGRGVFLGQETGGSFVCNGGFSEHRLTHTGFELLLPHASFVAEAHGLPLGRGIVPDIGVDYSVADLVDHRDIYLDSVLAIIRGDH